MTSLDRLNVDFIRFAVIWLLAIRDHRVLHLRRGVGGGDKEGGRECMRSLNGYTIIIH